MATGTLIFIANEYFKRAIKNDISKIWFIEPFLNIIVYSAYQMVFMFNLAGSNSESNIMLPGYMFTFQISVMFGTKASKSIIINMAGLFFNQLGLMVYS